VTTPGPLTQRSATTTAEPLPHPAAPLGRADAWRALGVAALVAALYALAFAGLWLEPGSWIPTHPQGDTARSFVDLRSFGYSEIARGHLPLWNPYTFSGTPFVGSFQSAIFDPLNLHYLVLPLAASVSVELLLRLGLLAGLSFLWLRGQRISPVAALVGAAVVALGATASLRVLAGALSVLGTYAWWPLVLLSVERLLDRGSLGWTLAGVGATTMMILAGHPPTVLMAATATALHVALQLPGTRQRVHALARLVPVAVAPLLLSAAQLWPGLHTASEGIRRGGMSLEFATSHSFPPLHLLTAISPEIFGNADLFNRSYFGQVFHWDAGCYLGAAPLLLLGVGVAADRRTPCGRARLAAFALLVAIAMGAYTPLYQLLYWGLPGFDLIRAPSKFLFFASVFAAALVARGWEVATRRPHGLGGARWLALGALAVCFVGVAGLGAAQLCEGGVEATIALLDRVVGARTFAAEGDPALWHALALRSLMVSGALLVAAGALVDRASASPRVRAALLVFCLLDLTGHAWLNRGGTQLAFDFDGRLWSQSVERTAGARRMLRSAPTTIVTVQDNESLGLRRPEVWGYDPVVLDRYARLMARTQDVDLDALEAPSLLQLHRVHPLHAMLRVGIELQLLGGRQIGHPGALERFELIPAFEVVTDREEAFARLLAPGFDPRAKVLLERAPGIEPAPPDGPAAPPTVLDQSTDHVDLEVTLASPAILLVTDAYSDGWCARALPGSSQTSYELMPANVALRAVPLAAGAHRLRIEYAPPASAVGHWVSGVSGAGWLALAGLAFRRRHGGALRGGAS